MTINKEQAVSDAVSDAMIEAGEQAFEMEMRRAGMPDDGRMVREIYLAMKAAAHPLEQQQAVSGDEILRLIKEWDDTEAFDATSLYLFTEALVGACRVALTASGVGRMREALERISSMTDIEADFDGFEARDIARTALQGGE